MKRLPFSGGNFFCPLTLLFIYLSLWTGCCGTPKPIPDWLNTSYYKLESYKKSYLMGNEKIAALQFKGLLSEVKKTGDLQVLGTVYLTRLALQTAVLEEMTDKAYRQLDEVSPDPQNRSFYAFLKGETARVDESLLPRQYRGVLRNLRPGSDADPWREIAEMEEPLSQLIAIGVVMRFRPDDEALMMKALDTASRQGWKKAVLVYLKRLQAYYEGKKELSKAQAIGQRLDLIRD